MEKEGFLYNSLAKIWHWEEQQRLVSLDENLLSWPFLFFNGSLTSSLVHNIVNHPPKLSLPLALLLEHLVLDIEQRLHILGLGR